MPRKGEYSDKYGFNVSSVRFDCGGEPLGSAAHGSLSAADIDGAQPTRYTTERARAGPESDSGDALGPTKPKFKGSSQPRNPLDPDYRLPEPPPPPVVSRPFIRDTLDVSDIEGSRRAPKPAPVKPDSSLNTADIAGSRPRALAPRQAEAPPRANPRLDVSDIAVKAKAPELRKDDARGKEAGLEDAVGRRRDAEWQKERNENMRKQGQEVAKAREAAEELVRGVAAAAAAPHAMAAALEAELRALDRQGSGAVRLREFEAAMQRSGLDIPPAKAKDLSAALGAGEGSGMVPYQDVLARLYDQAGPAPADAPPPPQWYRSRQRRVKTDVAVSLGQQPRATAAAAAAVSTPQERKDRARPAAGKKIAGLERPAREDDTKDSYWFADSRGGPEAGGAGGEDAPGGDTGGGLWFAAAGTDEAALEEMGTWRPTKDAAIANDLLKARSKGGAPGQGGGDDGAPPPPKAALLFAKPTPPTRQVRQMAEKDVEMVRRLG